MKAVATPAARKSATDSRRRGARGSPGRCSEEFGKIRAWAAANGYEVSCRGRISQVVRDAYDAAH
ncbi:Lsr2 family protein [Curtobacterium flaccumfaciens pv. flaccumfaciens]|uniref:Lsr2 family DNA-binding protein n=1 Tax=Curtobacterium flaccumfaciens TaxID=2035 RepID=UPI001BDF4BED|nr:histone-like nucleoid-structuring protein Lsr2 [Curtobacterium flaccumfaciens]MBT1669302.1 Lsr2 family protein [Curtobacterium flaccumfaciens pv. flaccumfaciens]